MTKTLTALAFASVLVAGFASASNAAPSLGTTSVGTASPIIQVDKRCGLHAHYVPAHHDAHHHLIRGRCVANHR